MNPDALDLNMDAINERVKEVGEKATDELGMIVYEACLGQTMMKGLKFDSGLALGQFVKAVTLLGVVGLQQKGLLGTFTPKAGPPAPPRQPADPTKTVAKQVANVEGPSIGQYL